MLVLGGVAYTVAIVIDSQISATANNSTATKNTIALIQSIYLLVIF
jgi:hypothetical protein